MAIHSKTTTRVNHTIGYTLLKPAFSNKNIYDLVRCPLLSLNHCPSSWSMIIINHSPLSPPSSSSLKVNNRSFRHASPCLWNQLPKELRLPTDHKDLSLPSDLTHVSSSSPQSPLSPSDSKLIFSTNLFLHSSSTFPPNGLTPRTPAVFRFSWACRF